jgi:nucleotide-binding universal stress UspA family protein
VIERILLTVDDTTESLRAAGIAARLGVDLRAQVTVLTVLEDAEDGSAPLEERRRAATNLLEYVRRQICADGVDPSRVRIHQGGGEPFRVILDEARAWPADMIVMAVSDDRRVRSNYVGSVTEQVIEFAACPVLVVPASTRRGDR